MPPRRSEAQHAAGFRLLPSAGSPAGPQAPAGSRVSNGEAAGYAPAVDWPGACMVIIPCFNEATSIATVVRGVLTYLPKVVVVDDGSTDGTAQAAASAGALVVRQPRNQGKGAALVRGWQEARARGASWALCLDGDGQHDPRDIPAFLVCAVQSGADLVVGNRFHNGAPPMSRLRQAVNRWMSRRLSIRTGQPMPDTQCGYRLLRLALLPRLGIVTQRFEIESELLVAILQAAGRVEFVPVHARRALTRSKMRPVRDTWRWLTWWGTCNGQPRISHPARSYEE